MHIGGTQFTVAFYCLIDGSCGHLVPHSVAGDGHQIHIIHIEVRIGSDRNVVLAYDFIVIHPDIGGYIGISILGLGQSALFVFCRPAVLLLVGSGWREVEGF